MQNTAQQQAEAIADSFSTKPAERITDYTRLNRAEVGSILKLHEAGKTQVEIAQILGCSQPTVSRWLDELVDTRELAKHTLRSGAEKLAERIVKQADVEQALEVLDRLDVAPKKRDTHLGNAIQIVVNTPGQTSLAPPSALFQSNQQVTVMVNIIANYQTLLHRGAA
jgi:predicted transcriptional regulator